jgi:tripartite-type tricarboxylate transporter receptor subunit TctC
MLLTYRSMQGFAHCAAALVVVLHAAAVHAQDFPVKTVRIIAAEPGGANDLATRLIAQGLTARLGQQVIVENRGGAGGAFAAEIVARAPPDGHTLLFYGAALWLQPFLRDNVPWDPLRDFAPLTMMISAPAILVTHPSLPVKTPQDLVALAKQRPGAIDYGSGGAGTVPHLAAELFNALAGVRTVRIPYRGAGPAVLALIGGQVQIMFATAGTVAPHIRAGAVRALAVTSAQRSALVPDLPPLRETLPGYELTAMWGMFAPAKVPAPLVARLNREIVQVLRVAETRERFASAGVEAAGSTPEEFAAALRSDMRRLGKLIKDAGIRAD